MNAKLKNLLVRTASGAVFVVLVICVNGVKGVSESSVKMVCVYRVLVVSMNSIKGMSKSCVEMISVQ